jgi:hypothetical protein
MLPPGVAVGSEDADGAEDGVGAVEVGAAEGGPGVVAVGADVVWASDMPAETLRSVARVRRRMTGNPEEARPLGERGSALDTILDVALSG